MELNVHSQPITFCRDLRADPAYLLPRQLEDNLRRKKSGGDQEDGGEGAQGSRFHATPPLKKEPGLFRAIERAADRDSASGRPSA